MSGLAGPAAALALAAPAAPAHPPIPSPLMRPVPLSRVTLDASPQSVDASGDAGRQAAAAPAGPDLDVLADYVLERLRHELRDGRERLGFLLDDAR